MSRRLQAQLDDIMQNLANDIADDAQIAIKIAEIIMTYTQTLEEVDE